MALSLLVGGFTQFEDNIRAIVNDRYQSDLTVELITYLVALEIALRLANDAIRGALQAVSTRRQRPSAAHNGDEQSKRE